MLELKHFLDDNYLTKNKLTAVLTDFNNLQSNFDNAKESMKEECSNFMDSFKSRFHQLVSELMKNKFKEYDHVKKSFGKFFNHEGLQKVLDNKANLQDLQQVNLERASKEELEEQKICIDSLNERIKLLSVLQTEISEIMGENTIQKKIDYIRK